jgi:glycerol-3-phosphate dehydrogenase (NAD(P)+)
MSQDQAPVGVLGGGSWGTTIAHLLGVNGRDAILWLRNDAVAEEINRKHTNSKYLGDRKISPRVHATLDMAEVTRKCQVIYFVVPLKGVREAAYHMGSTIKGDRIVISCSKGLDATTRLRPTEVIKRETCVKKIGVLSGPNLAREIMDGQPCATVIASHFHEVIERGTEAIMGSQFRVYGSEDLLGVELAGALKNIYALAAGIVDGLGLGANAKAALITRGLWEMTRYVVARGGKPLTLAGLAGVGDLIATCGSALSRNNQVGRRLAKGETREQIVESMVQTAEGINTTRVIHAHAQEIGCEMPITEAMYQILYEGSTPIQALSQLMARPSTFETAGLAAS